MGAAQGGGQSQKLVPQIAKIVLIKISKGKMELFLFSISLECLHTNYLISDEKIFVLLSCHALFYSKKDWKSVK
jgi:hypothetical protein